MQPARRRGAFLSAAIAAVAAVVALALPSAAAPASAAPAAENGVGASHPGMILAVGIPSTVSAGEGRRELPGQPQFASGACVAAEAGPLSDQIASTFRGGQYSARTLENDTVLYRAGIDGKPLGQFFSEDAPVSEIQTRIDKAIPPEWSDGTPAPIDTGYAILIPRGTTVYEGDVANQGGWYMGGTNQVFVSEPWNVPGVQVVGSWRLT
jgi:hypothetical protein